LAARRSVKSDYLSASCISLYEGFAPNNIPANYDWGENHAIFAFRRNYRDKDAYRKISRAYRAVDNLNLPWTVSYPTMTRHLLSLAAFVQVGCWTAVEAAGSETIDLLIKNSPFGAPAAAVVSPALPADQFELRGIFADRGEIFFSVQDTSSHVGRWLQLNETGGPFVVRRYDAAQNSVVIEFQGREIALQLKQAKITGLPPGGLPAASNDQLPTPGAMVGSPEKTGGQVTTPLISSYADPAARMAAIMKEVNRREALRAQALHGTAAKEPATGVAK
jgi:hypothetical protein